MAQIATSSSDDALDLVQEAMFKLVEKYRDQDPGEWTPLFYRILHNRIHDWYRRNSVRNRYHQDLPANDESDTDPIQNAKDERGNTPEQNVVLEFSMERLQQLLEKLPLRQQQAFLLRAWEGLDTRQTAQAMSCSEGSVKTHYSRAIHTLRLKLGDHWK